MAVEHHDDAPVAEVEHDPAGLELEDVAADEVLLPVQSLQDGFTPFYLELDELPGMNLGWGSAQIDLESDAFDWACG